MSLVNSFNCDSVKKKNRILVDARWIKHESTGVGNYCRQLLSHLPDDSHDFLFLVSDKFAEAKVELKGKVIPVKIKLDSHPFTELFEQFWIPFKCFSWNCNGFVSFEGRVPLLHPTFKTYSFIYDVSTWSVAQSHNFKYTTLMRWNLFLSKISATKILTISKTVKQNLIENHKVKPTEVEVIYPASSLLKNLEPSGITELKDKTFFLTVGITNNRKNLKYMLEAFRILRELKGNIYFAVTGNSVLIQSLIEEKEVDEGILNLGFVSDTQLSWLYSNCEGLIFASKDEGFGIPLVDAAEFGKPIFCSDIPVFREVAKDNANYFSLSDPESLYQELMLQLEHPISKDVSDLGFSWEASSDKFQTLFKNRATKWLFDITMLRPDIPNRGIPRLLKDMLHVVMAEKKLSENVEYIVEQQYVQHVLANYPELSGKIYVVKNNPLKWPIARGFLSKYRYQIPKGKYQFIFQPESNALLSRNDTPQVLMVYDFIYYKYWKEYLFNPFELKLVVYYLYMRWKSRIFKNVSAFLCISKYTRDELLGYHKISKLKTSVLSLSPTPLPSLDIKQTKEKISNEIAKLTSSKILLYVGGFDFRKNVTTLITTVGDYCKSNECQLVLAGSMSDSEKRSALETIEKRGLGDCVKIFQNVSDVELVYLYQCALVFVFMSLYEGFGLPLVEAMSQGVPVIAFKNSAVEEVVEGAGVLVPQSDTRKFIESIEGLLSNEKLRRSYGEKGIEQSKKFTQVVFSNSLRRKLKNYIEINET